MGSGRIRMCKIIVLKPARRLVVFTVLQLFIFTAAYVVLINSYHDDTEIRGVATDSLPQQQPLLSQPERMIETSGRAVKHSPLKRRSGHGKTFKEYRDLIFHKPLRIACSTCAVVSSSGHLLGTRAGPFIDSHECVFRMNNAPVVGHEADVGTRTTVRSMANVNLVPSFASVNHSRREILTSKDTRTEIVLINWMDQQFEDRNRKGKQYLYALMLAGKYQRVQFYEFTQKKMVEAEKRFQNETGITKSQANTWLSTGWFTMIAALDICEHVTVVGMVPKDHCEKHGPGGVHVPYHYYDVSGPTECQYYNVSEKRLDGGHLFITEKAIFARWSRRRDITFRHPSWSAETDVGSGEQLDTPFLNRYRELQTRYNSSFANVADYLRWRKDRSSIPGRRMRLQLGNRTFDVNNREVLRTILDLLPHSKRLGGTAALGGAAAMTHGRS